ncbi:MAG TPA: glutathione S-transferase family protein [Steroidobacteraceae bacterium]|nr:glutathione S-transferase family protein [Steroidobacteraceae bacterium]HUO19930.1 glutathione S-transferase family protein [Steroidobacteraceae bacterium]
MYELYIGNKNYSSWSLRPWVLMREAGIGFKEQLIPFGHPSWRHFRTMCPSGRVPCLFDGEATVWDSLAIVEYLAERHAGVWPQDPRARAWARSAAAEMHSGFAELRNRCSMSCGVRIRLKEAPEALQRDLARLEALWNDGLARFGGAFLAANTFTAVDAFFAPVAFRVQTYGLELGARAAHYAARLLELPSMRAWYADALAETFRDEPHEAEILAAGTLLEDLRRR